VAGAFPQPVTVKALPKASHRYRHPQGHAMRTGWADGDPTRALKGALTPWRPMPFAAATTPAVNLATYPGWTSRPSARDRVEVLRLRALAMKRMQASC